MREKLGVLAALVGTPRRASVGERVVLITDDTYRASGDPGTDRDTFSTPGANQ